MADEEDPIARATADLQALVDLLKKSAIPGMRPKDQETILKYLLRVTNNLIEAQKLLDNGGISQAALNKVKEKYERESEDYWESMFKGWKKSYIEEIQGKILDAHLERDDDD